MDNNRRKARKRREAAFRGAGEGRSCWFEWFFTKNLGMLS